MAVKRGLGRGLGGGIDSVISPKTARDNQKRTAKEVNMKTAKQLPDETSGQHGNSGIATEASGSSQAQSIRVQKSEKRSAGNTTMPEAEKAKTAGKEEQADMKTAGDVKSTSNNGGEVLLSILDVEPNREQPRKVFDEDALQELADSIRQYGILSPILVQKNGDYYEIIAGERRWRAAKIAGLKEIPVIIREYSRQEVVEISLIENIQREDLNPIEEARAYKRLLTEFDLTQETVAARVSKSRAAITNSTRLLKLDPRVQEMLIDGSITAGHARALLSISDGELQYSLAQRIAEEALSVREIEKLVKHTDQLKTELPRVQKEDMLAFVYRDMEERMTGALGTKVSIRRGKGKKGKIEISYHSDEELERLAEMFLTALH